MLHRRSYANSRWRSFPPACPTPMAASRISPPPVVGPTIRSPSRPPAPYSRSQVHCRFGRLCYIQVSRAGRVAFDAATSGAGVGGLVRFFQDIENALYRRIALVSDPSLIRIVFDNARVSQFREVDVMQSQGDSFATRGRTVILPREVVDEFVQVRLSLGLPCEVLKNLLPDRSIEHGDDLINGEPVQLGAVQMFVVRLALHGRLKLGDFYY